MKRFFAGAIVVAALLYATAELTLERPPDDGVIRLRWATDPNPARNLQTETFGKLQVLLKAEDVLDWAALLRRLRARAGKGGDVVSGRLLERLDPNAVGAAAAPQGRAAVLAAINAALERRDLFASEDVEGVDLPPDARLLLDKPPGERTNVEVVALNRRILEAALGEVLRPARRVEVTVESGQAEKLIVQCATGTGPDVIDVYGINQMLTYVQAGILVDLTPHAAKMGFAPENTYPAIKGNLLVGGRQYRYPCNVWANCVIYNRKVFDDHGVAYPAEGWTVDDFIRLGKRILAGAGKSGTKHLAVANWSSTWMFEDFLLGHGGRYFTPDGLRSRLDAPEAVAAMTLYHDMMHVHRILPTPAEAAAMSSQGGWGSGGIRWFCDGKAAMIFIGRWLLNRLGSYPEICPHLGTARLPRVDGRASSGQTDCRGAGVNVKSPHRDAALRFLQYLAGEDYGRLIVKDGDSLPPNPALARTGEDLVNDTIPDPEFHRPFAEAMGPARPIDTSPFIDGGQVARWVTEMIGKIENRLVTPEEGMKALAAEINQRIRTNLERRDDLQRTFRQVTGRPYTRDWKHPVK